MGYALRHEVHLRRIIAALERAERLVHSVEPVIEACALYEIARLQQGDRLRVGQSHGVLQVQVRLSIEVETLVRCLRDATIDADQCRAVTNLTGREVAEEEIQIAREEGLRRKLD